MVQQTLSQAGAFSGDDINIINSNFSDLYTNNRLPANMTAAGALATTNANRITTVNSAAGIAITLPPSTGSGNTYPLFIGTTITSGNTTITAAGSDKISGNSYQSGAAGAATAFYIASGTTVTFNGSTKGGIKGDYLSFRDVSAGLWQIEIDGSITGTAATPFS